MTSDSVYRLREKQIILGHLKRRGRLPESALCRRFKVSRTLLREVFRRFEGAGLVTLQPNRGSPSGISARRRSRTSTTCGRRWDGPRFPLSCSGSGPKTSGAPEARGRVRGGLSPRRHGRDDPHQSGLPPPADPGVRECLPSTVAGGISPADTSDPPRRGLSAAHVQRSIREHKTILMALVRCDGATLWRVVRGHLATGRGDYRRIFPVGEGVDHVPGFRRPRAG